MIRLPRPERQAESNFACGRNELVDDPPRAEQDRPATYRCPFCGELLHAMSEHVVIAPEGDVDRRRHAHMTCVRAERAAGRFKLYDDVSSEHG